MLEYLTFKKVKKHREEKASGKAKSEQWKGVEKQPATGSAKAETPQPAEDAASSVPATSASPAPQIISSPADDADDETPVDGTPILDHEDEKFLERLTSSGGSAADNDDETPPPLPPRVKTPVIDIDSDDASSIASKGREESKNSSKGKEKKPESPGEHTKSKRFSFMTNLPRNISLRRNKPAATAGLKPDHLAVPSTSEADKEKTDMARVLDDLNLSARENRAFSLSSESADMARKFTQVLKDLVNGVPTAYGDLVSLLDDRDGVLARTFEKLPSSLKKLVAQLPEKLTSTLAPELLAVAAEAQGLSAEEGKEGGLKDAAKKFLTPANLHDLVTKPGALVGLLKGIVNALKTRFPAFVGTNVLWSLAVFLLLSMLWYCYKRGRDVRLEREASDAAVAAGRKANADVDDNEIEGRPRVEELPDDPMLTSTTTPAAATPTAAPKTGAVAEGA
ncbi:hypothetical protein F5Y09DRAFT_322255 [Xylaria sp. FL1042]|nr:hypothetical protein F5Y09DRAFT_322255 [Xylaria sp. FL1042]